MVVFALINFPLMVNVECLKVFRKFNQTMHERVNAENELGNRQLLQIRLAFSVQPVDGCGRDYTRRSRLSAPAFSGLP
jgi:hypothetical protein